MFFIISLLTYGCPPRLGPPGAFFLFFYILLQNSRSFDYYVVVRLASALRGQAIMFFWSFTEKFKIFHDYVVVRLASALQGQKIMFFLIAYWKNHVFLIFSVVVRLASGLRWQKIMFFWSFTEKLCFFDFKWGCPPRNGPPAAKNQVFWFFTAKFMFFWF